MIGSKPFPSRSVPVSTDRFETTLLFDKENLCTDVEIILNDHQSTREENQIPETIAFSKTNENDLVSGDGPYGSQQINCDGILVKVKQWLEEVIQKEQNEEENHQESQEEDKIWSDENRSAGGKKNFQAIKKSLRNEELKSIESKVADRNAHKIESTTSILPIHTLGSDIAITNEIREENSFQSSLTNEVLKSLEQEIADITLDGTKRPVGYINSPSTLSMPTQQSSDTVFRTLAYSKRESKVKTPEVSSSTQILSFMMKRDKDIAAKRKKAISRAREEAYAHLLRKEKVAEKKHVSMYSRSVKGTGLVIDEKMEEEEGATAPNVSDSSDSQSKQDKNAKDTKKKILRSFLERDREIAKRRQQSLLKARQDRDKIFHKDTDHISLRSYQISDEGSLSSLYTARSTSSRFEQLYQKGKNDRRRNDLEKSIRDKAISNGGGAEDQLNDDTSVVSALSMRSSTPLRFEQLYQKGKNERRSDLKRSIQEK